jgi:ornithine cyclodeaminase
VRGSDIVTTVTADKRNATILTPEMIEAGMHLNAIGGDCPGKTELHADILRRPDARVVVEYEPQSRIEGEIQQLEPTFPVIELTEVLNGRAPGRAHDGEVTIFDSVGFALEDFSSLHYLYQLLRADGREQPQIDLVPDLRDPKDLFSVLNRQQSRATGIPAPRRAEAKVRLA